MRITLCRRGRSVLVFTLVRVRVVVPVWAMVHCPTSAPLRPWSMIPKSGNRFSEKIMLREKAIPMTAASAEPLTIELEDAQRVSGLLIVPPGARACYVLAHGAGAGMTH